MQWAVPNAKMAFELSRRFFFCGILAAVWSLFWRKKESSEFTCVERHHFLEMTLHCFVVVRPFRVLEAVQNYLAVAANSHSRRNFATKFSKSQQRGGIIFNPKI